MYVHQLPLLQSLIWASYATYNVDVVLLVMAFIVTSAAISQLCVYLCYIVYKLVMFMERG